MQTKTAFLPGLRLVPILWSVLMMATAHASEPTAAPYLRVSENRRFLVREDGQPFFWLGDTAWELLHRLGKADAEHYLKTRAQQGFNVVQCVLLSESKGRPQNRHWTARHCTRQCPSDLCLQTAGPRHTISAPMPIGLCSLVPVVTRMGTTASGRCALPMARVCSGRIRVGGKRFNPKVLGR